MNSEHITIHNIGVHFSILINKNMGNFRTTLLHNVNTSLSNMRFVPLNYALDSSVLNPDVHILASLHKPINITYTIQENLATTRFSKAFRSFYGLILRDFVLLRPLEQQEHTHFYALLHQ